jgi:hypothetical protein
VTVTDPATPPPKRTHRFTTDAQEEFRRGGRRRLVWAGAVALAGLAALVLLGPDERAVKEKFEYYGAPSDEMRIMPEISIEDGSDIVSQIPKSLQVPPPPANMDIIEEEEDPDAVEAKPEEKAEDPNELDVAVDNPQPDAETSSDHQVEMTLPTQSSTDWFILEMVRPEYPLDASESERRTRIIFVNLWIFVRPDGTVSDVMVTSTNGGQTFIDATTEALLKWRFGWRVDPGIGRQIQMTWRFKSPYFTTGRGF